MENEIIPGVVADRYEECMAVFEQKGQLSITSTLEMWNALLEIYSRKLWVAKFNTAEDWIAHVSELGYTGMGRSNIFSKLSAMKQLMVSGVKQEIAAAAVTAVPGAVRAMGSSQEILSLAKGGDPNDYVGELIYLSPSEAIKRVRTDKGNRVEMWIHEVVAGSAPGTLIGTIVRSDDQRGYSSYDFKLTIEPQIPGNRDMLPNVSSWLVYRIRGKSDNNKTR